MRAVVERAGYWRRVRNGYAWARHFDPRGNRLLALWGAWDLRNEWRDDE